MEYAQLETVNIINHYLKIFIKEFGSELPIRISTIDPNDYKIIITMWFFLSGCLFFTWKYLLLVFFNIDLDRQNDDCYLIKLLFLINFYGILIIFLLYFGFNLFEIYIVVVTIYSISTLCIYAGEYISK